VHKASCDDFKKLSRQNPKKVVSVEWD